MKVIDAKGVYYQQLNAMIKDSFKSGEEEITLNHISGQRYIGDGISGKQKLIINGTPGNDMSAFMDGLEIKHGAGPMISKRGSFNTIL